MADTNPRLRAVWDLSVAEVREYAGRHEYDGRIQDLSPGGVRAGLRRLADAASAGGRLDDEHDEAHLAVFERADAERDRLSELLAESCARVDPGRPAIQVARDLVRQHPDADGVIEAARVWTKRAIDFTREAALVPYNDGECLVLLAPESRRWAMAMMSTAAPGEPEGPSRYYITPPDSAWPEQEAQEWLEGVSGTTPPRGTVRA